mmetsp:Transcript_21458/g.33061  ORF Transcript_21458/g.33061 Transcript_21458/m.33061 type:complete len:422 (+) Transcript_21458:177-1442(+)|eukprot:CAMPEP_0195284880 /NCGR_PEP_ID=MMETSP0707-20130614/2920_1 /TAXON_ID=33640 /ORGANISM="Asterionellopsis glacialis, Strain CCMP134" /LENGTH=421 /DNA_ID=CAMNT_0040344285 /DNA_START=160 /DNA_END=1425 /DNA_ORIENTATION=+
MTEKQKIESDNAVQSSIHDTLRKMESSLLPAIEDHVKTDGDFDAAKDGFDFLDAKNSMMLSYMIDLTYRLRHDIVSKNKKNFPPISEDSWQRLTEMSTALDKTRPLEKKMRYQLDKLLTATTTGTSFASGSGAGSNGAGATDDPLQYRPNPKSLKSSSGTKNTGDKSDSDEYDKEEDSKRKDLTDEDNDSVESGDKEDDDDDLEAAKATMARVRVSKEAESDDDEQDNDGIYRAPRMASVPFPSDTQASEERAKRKERRLNTSEFVQTLRSQYGEAPEQEDMHGGTEYGKQREAARRLAERQAEQTQYEEDAMVRLVTSRKDKKEAKRLLREEASNLSAIADLGNLVRGVSTAFSKDKDGDDRGDAEDEYGDHGRRNQFDEVTGKSKKGRAKKVSKNSLQSALYGGGGSSSGSASKKRRKR